jgi:hypothetical protein
VTVTNSHGQNFHSYTKYYELYHYGAQVMVMHVDELAEQQLENINIVALSTLNGRVVGLAPSFGIEGRLSALAIATGPLILIINLTGPEGKKKWKAKDSPDGEFLSELPLCEPSVIKVAFRMDVVATALYWDHGLRIINALDLLCIPAIQRHSFAAPMGILGPLANVANARQMHQTITIAGEFSSQKIALQAWTAQYASKLKENIDLIEGRPTINTLKMSSSVSSTYLARDYVPYIRKEIMGHIENHSQYLPTGCAQADSCTKRAHG